MGILGRRGSESRDLAILYGISATGQKLSAHQMEELKDRIDSLVEGLEAEAP